MHEYSLLRGLMKQIRELAEQYQAIGVQQIKVRVGALCHLSEEHFLFHFREIAKGSIAEGAQIIVEVLSDEYEPNAGSIILEECQLICPGPADQLSS